MAEKSQTTSKTRRSPGGGSGVGSAANGNGHPNGNGHSNGNGRVHSDGNGHHANGNGNGHANGNGNGAAGTEEVRRIATEMGAAMLTTTSVDTARHCDDVELITDAIAEKFDFSDSERSDLRAGARLHDIGKAAIPPEILVKPGPLDADEWDVMLQHTIIGEQILGSVTELDGIAKIVRHSHERWDGDGYPDGLAGEDIPLGSRIVFCADAFHAVRSDRPYRDGRSAAEALTEIRRCSGTQFDPDVVAALESVVRELQIVGPGRRAYRSSRLTALLLALVVGAGGSAVAGSQLFGGGGDSAGSDANTPGAESQGGVLGKRASSTGKANHKTRDGSGGSGSAHVRSGGGNVGGARSDGVVLNDSSRGSDDSNGGSSSGGGTNGNTNSNHTSGGGTSGQSGNAPGHGGTCPGNSCNSSGNSSSAPGHQADGPGNSNNAPGPGGPGNSSNAPGHQADGPGNSNNAPGHSP